MRHVKHFFHGPLSEPPAPRGRGLTEVGGLLLASVAGSLGGRNGAWRGGLAEDGSESLAKPGRLPKSDPIPFNLKMSSSVGEGASQEPRDAPITSPRGPRH